MGIKKIICIIALALLLIAIVTSCKKSEKEIETSCIKSAVEKIYIDDSIKWIVILPGLGCNGCIQEAEAFMKRNIENRNVFFVLTNISSIKILQQKINIVIENRGNIYVDRENIFSIPTDNSIYPCIIKIKEGKILDHEFQSPQNGSAFHKLKKQILDKKI